MAALIQAPMPLVLQLEPSGKPRRKSEHALELLLDFLGRRNPATPQDLL
jgi:hypothetical protein